MQAHSQKEKAPHDPEMRAQSFLTFFRTILQSRISNFANISDNNFTAYLGFLLCHWIFYSDQITRLLFVFRVTSYKCDNFWWLTVTDGFCRLNKPGGAGGWVDHYIYPHCESMCLVLWVML